MPCPSFDMVTLYPMTRTQPLKYRFDVFQHVVSLSRLQPRQQTQGNTDVPSEDTSARIDWEIASE